MGLADRFKEAVSFGGRRLPHAGGHELVELHRQGPLGPCRATVVVSGLRLESGRRAYRIDERWTPPHDGFGEITETEVLYDAVRAVEAGKQRADEWRAGSARSELLAPGGRLRHDGDWTEATISLGPPR
jgi:hypothetical protein